VEKTIEIRKATFRDAKTIAKINKESLGYDFPAEYTESQLCDIEEIGLDMIYVATIDEAVVGYIHATPYVTLYHKPMINILGLAVDKEYQHQGIGKMLIEKIENIALHKNYFGVRLNSGVERGEAHKFYEAVGYKRIKEQVKFEKEINPKY
jgi:GNAT superfamily N-acetyltransferase